MKNTNLRKAISMFITVMLMLSMITSAFATASAEAFRKGDVDGDDVVGMSDVVLLQRAIAELVQLTEQQANAGDVTYDTEDKMEDVVEIQRYIAKLIPGFNEPVTEKKIEVGSTVTVKAGSVNDANGAKIDAFERYVLYVVKEINGENAKIEARYLFNGHTSVMTHEVKLADLELSEKALDFGEVSTELKVGAAVILTKADATLHDRLLVYKVLSIGTEENAAVELEANYILKGVEYKVTKSVTAADVALYTGTELTWGATGNEHEIAVGDSVLIEAGAKTYAGENIADFWFLGQFTVDSIEADKAVISMKADKDALEIMGLTTQMIAELVNANKDAILAMPTEDLLEIAARFGVKINNMEKLNSLTEMIKTTTITAEMLDVALSTLNYSVRFEMKVADLTKIIMR